MGIWNFSQSTRTISLDDTAPDENVVAFFAAAERHWR
jgi:hypothetical protein